MKIALCKLLYKTTLRQNVLGIKNTKYARTALTKNNIKYYFAQEI